MSILIKSLYLKLFLNWFILMKKSRKYLDKILNFTIKFVVFIGLLHYTFFIRTSKFELWVNVLIFSWCFRLKMFLFCSYCNIFIYSVTGIMSYSNLLGLWLWLNFVKCVYILNPSQSQLVVLKLFLLFADFKPQCYYKIVITEKKSVFIRYVCLKILVVGSQICFILRF